MIVHPYSTNQDSVLWELCTYMYYTRTNQDSVLWELCTYMYYTRTNQDSVLWELYEYQFSNSAVLGGYAG